MEMLGVTNYVGVLSYAGSGKTGKTEEKANGPVNFDNMFDFAVAIGRGEVRLQEVHEGGAMSLEFTDKQGRIVATGKEIPHSGHYDYAVTTKNGRVIGITTMLVGIHYKYPYPSGQEVAWSVPKGREKDFEPGVMNIKTTELPPRGDEDYRLQQMNAHIQKDLLDEVERAKTLLKATRELADTPKRQGRKINRALEAF